MRWYGKSTAQGHAVAQNDLGYMYQHGLGVRRDCAEALRWYRQSAGQRDDSGQNNLGWMLEHGLIR